MRSRFAAMCAPMLDMRPRLSDGTVTALSVLTLLAAGTAPAMAQDKLWITQFSSNSSDYPYALASDGAGGVMVAGRTQGNLGGPMGGINDGYIARRDAAGTKLWVRQFGTSESDVAWALAPDGAGGVMVAGETQGSLGGANLGNTDVFVARYDADGAQLWIRQFGTSNDDWAYALAPDGAGGVMVAGPTGGSLGGANAGNGDVFVARYDANGNQLWVRQFGTTVTDDPFALASDGAGGVMVAGSTSGSLGGANAGATDAFVARYDADGTRLWIRQFGTSTTDEALALAPDGAGGVMVAGVTRGSLGGPNAGGEDAFVARYDANGTRLWIRQFGTSKTDYANALAPDGAGGVMVAGWTSGSLGGAIAGPFDVFIAQFGADGTQLWVRQFGSGRGDAAHALASDGAGGVMVTGQTNGSLGGANAGRGDTDVFVARYVPCYADLDTSTGAGTLDIFDFLAFQNAFVFGELAACDCDTSTGWLVCDIFDFLCFQSAFVAGCP